MGKRKPKSENSGSANKRTDLAKELIKLGKRLKQSRANLRELEKETLLSAYEAFLQLLDDKKLRSEFIKHVNARTFRKVKFREKPKKKELLEAVVKLIYKPGYSDATVSKRKAILFYALVKGFTKDELSAEIESRNGFGNLYSKISAKKVSSKRQWTRRKTSDDPAYSEAKRCCPSTRKLLHVEVDEEQLHEILRIKGTEITLTIQLEEGEKGFRAVRLKRK